MKRIIITLFVILLFTSIDANAQQPLPKGYEEKTLKLAENLVKSSKSGNYNKTYHALRQIQKYEWRLDKEQLINFYSDIHQAVADACVKFDIDAEGKQEMKVIIDALFSDELKEASGNF